MTASQVKSVTTNDVDFPNKIILDYIISHAQGDQRPYLKIEILGCSILALLDSGASRTLVGLPGYELLLSLGLKLQKESVTCTVANGQHCSSIGFIQTPITLKSKTKILDIIVLPELSHQIILGIDFWRAMEIVPDMRQDVWHFTDQSESSFVDICSVQSVKSLSELEKSELNNLIERKFDSMGTEFGCCKVAPHDIELEPGTKPIKQRYYPVSPHKQKIIDDEVEEMLKLGVIERSKSPWSSPVCLVHKKDGSYRFCIDFRRLNAVSKKDAYPIPYISAILDRLRNARFISSIDIKSAFWQVPLTESCKEYTAFTVPGRGLFQFRRMPFGLTNAPATWQRIIDTILGPELEPYVMVYLDDIIIISSEFSDHLKLLETVFDRLKEAGLVVSKEKCHFCKPELKYLGYLVDAKGLRPDPEKVEAIVNIPPPQNITEIRRFIGTASWYRRFVPNFSTLLSPILHLTKKNVKWSWTPDCQKSFIALKECLVTAPVLTCPDFDKTFYLQTDASSYGLGAVLTQKFEDGEKVISYLSRSLTKQEMKLTVTEKECLAVIWSIEKLRHYLDHVHFKVITDHASLLWLHRLKDPQGRLARWQLRIQQFDFEMIHRKGKENIVPDFLSRAVPVQSNSIQLNVMEYTPEVTDKWYTEMKNKVQQYPEKFPVWRIENDRLYKYVKSVIPELNDLSEEWKLVVPKDHRKQILQRFHDIPASGHFGTYKTYKKILHSHYWPKMKSDIAKYVKSCHVCAQHKVEQKRPAGLMGERPEISVPFQVISLDYIGPLPRSKQGNCYILVISDYFSKAVFMFPCRKATSKSLIKHVEDVFLTYGTPAYLICDNGAQMKSKEFKKLCELYHTKIFYTSSYNPRANPTERHNRVIKTMIRSYIQKDNHRTWDVHLSELGCAIRSAPSETTGYTPNRILFGREHVLYGDNHLLKLQENRKNIDTYVKDRQVGFEKLYEQIKNKIQSTRTRQANHYNLRRRPLQFNVDDKVWRKNKVLSDASKYYSAKLAPGFVGPFLVKRKIGSWTYELQDELGNSKGIWHVQELKPFYDPSFAIDECS